MDREIYEQQVRWCWQTLAAWQQAGVTHVPREWFDAVKPLLTPPKGPPVASGQRPVPPRPAVNSPSVAVPSVAAPSKVVSPAVVPPVVATAAPSAKMSEPSPPPARTAGTPIPPESGSPVAPATAPRTLFGELESTPLPKKPAASRPAAAAAITPTAKSASASGSAVTVIAAAKAAVVEGPPLSREQRASQLTVLSEAVSQCTRCEVLVRNRTRTVFDVGNIMSPIVFVGEAPGADEDAQGEPFVGKAGQLLNKIITASKLKREDLYICNVLKCRPPDNRPPEPTECANCREFLEGQLRIIQPKYIVCWGLVAASNVLGIPPGVSMGKLRGKFHEVGNFKVLCTYHPSYLLRYPPAKKDVWEDMKFFMADMGVNLTATSGE